MLRFVALLLLVLLVACKTASDATLDAALLSPADLGSTWFVVSSTPVDSSGKGPAVIGACESTKSKARNLSRRTSGEPTLLIQSASMRLSSRSAPTCLAELEDAINDSPGAERLTPPSTVSSSLIWSVPRSGSRGRAIFVFLQSHQIAVFLNLSTEGDVTPSDVDLVVLAADKRLSPP